MRGATEDLFLAILRSIHWKVSNSNIFHDAIRISSIATKAQKALYSTSIYS